MDLLQLVKDKPVLSIGGAAAVIGGAISAFFAADARYAHSADVLTKAEVEKNVVEVKANADKHAAEDKVRADKQDNRLAWMLYGQTRIETVLLRNRLNDCSSGPIKPGMQAACTQYQQEYDDAHARMLDLYKAAQQAAK